jgi:hypothetical protein
LWRENTTFEPFDEPRVCSRPIDHRRIWENTTHLLFLAENGILVDIDGRRLVARWRFSTENTNNTH